GAFRPAGDGGEARFGLDQEIISLALRERSLVAIAADRAADEGRVAAPQLLDREAEARQRAGFQVLDQNIGLGDQGAKPLAILRSRKIEDDGFLATVQPDEIARLALRRIIIAARKIALRPLDLDDARARIGEAARAIGSRDRLLDGDDQETLER